MAGMSDSPTIRSGLRPSSKMVTSKPFWTSSDASVAPEGPLPIIPTVLVLFLIGATGFLRLRSEPTVYYVVLFMQTIPRPVRLVKFEFGGGGMGSASGYYRRALWSQIRNPKPETRNKFKCPMIQGQEPPAGQWFGSFPAWCLGFVSGFEFRVCALWMAVFPRCTQPAGGIISEYWARQSRSFPREPGPRSTGSRPLIT